MEIRTARRRTVTTSRTRSRRFRPQGHAVDPPHAVHLHTPCTLSLGALRILCTPCAACRYLTPSLAALAAQALVHDKGELERELDSALQIEETRSEPVLKSFVILGALLMLCCGMREHRLCCFGRGRCCGDGGRCRDGECARRWRWRLGYWRRCRDWCGLLRPMGAGATPHRPLRLPSRAHGSRSAPRIAVGTGGGVECERYSSWGRVPSSPGSPTLSSVSGVSGAPSFHSLAI